MKSSFEDKLVELTDGNGIMYVIVGALIIMLITNPTDVQWARDLMRWKEIVG